MFNFCSMIIKRVIIFFFAKILSTLSIFSRTSLIPLIFKPISFKVFVVSSSLLFSPLQLLTALMLPNTYLSQPLHMMPAVLQLHSHGLYEILPPSTAIFVIMLCNQFALYSQCIDHLSISER